MATVRITNLRLRAIIGANDWERDVKQDVVINVTFEYDAAKATKSDNLKDTVDYKVITKKIIKAVESSNFELIEKMAAMVLDIVLEDKKVTEASVRVDKPLALRFADSVSIELHKKEKMINRAVIGIGSNISPKENIAKALELIENKFFIISRSKFIQTKAIGRIKQDDFINGAVLVETHLDAYELRALLKKMEVEIGREHAKDPFAARVIDFDLIVWNGQILDKDFYDRDFLKTTTLEVLPDLKY